MAKVVDSKGKEIGVGDYIKFKPHADTKHPVIGRVMHLEKHHVPKLDKDGDHIQKKVDLAKGQLGGVETEERTGQVMYFRANTTEVCYFDPAVVEVVMKADGTQPK